MSLLLYMFPVFFSWGSPSFQIFSEYSGLREHHRRPADGVYKINMCIYLFFQQSNTGHQCRQHQLNASTLASRDAKECFRFRGGDYWIAINARGVVGKRATAARTQSAVLPMGLLQTPPCCCPACRLRHPLPWDCCCCRSCLQLSSSGNLCTLCCPWPSFPMPRPQHPCMDRPQGHW